MRIGIVYIWIMAKCVKNIKNQTQLSTTTDSLLHLSSLYHRFKFLHEFRSYLYVIGCT